MTQSTASRAAGGAGGPSPWATGLALFAGIMMVMSGVMDFFYGIMAIAQDDVFVKAPNYVFKFSTTSWGWIHLVLGVLLVAVGAGVLMRKSWARMTGIFIVAVAGIGNFFSMPYYPLWSLVLLAIDVFVIWGLATVHAEDAF
jgi:hypothetical protein